MLLELLILEEDYHQFRIACFESKSMSQRAAQKEKYRRKQNGIQMHEILRIR